MTSRERIIAMIRGEEIDRIPWMPMMVGDYLRTLPGWPAGKGMGRETERVRFMVKFYAEIGADLVTYNQPPYCRRRYEGAVKRKWEAGDEPGEGRTVIETPIGTLSQKAVSRDGYSFLMEPLVDTPEDCRILSYALDAEVFEDAFEAPEMYVREIGESGIAFSITPCAVPSHMLMSRTMEAEQLLCGLMSGEPELLRLLESWHKSNLRHCESACRSPLTVFTDGGAMSTGMLSPDLYRKYCVPQMQEYCSALHRAGKLKVAHAVGEPFKGLLPDVPETGIDALMGFREETVNNATLEDVREAWHGRVCVVGGIDTDYLCRLRGDEMKARAEEFVKRIRKDDRMVLSTSSATMPGTPKENFQAVTELAREYLWPE